MSFKLKSGNALLRNEAAVCGVGILYNNDDYYDIHHFDDLLMIKYLLYSNISLNIFSFFEHELQLKKNYNLNTRVSSSLTSAMITMASENNKFRSLKKDFLSYYYNVNNLNNLHFNTFIKDFDIKKIIVHLKSVNLSNLVLCLAT